MGVAELIMRRRFDERAYLEPPPADRRRLPAGPGVLEHAVAGAFWMEDGTCKSVAADPAGLSGACCFHLPDLYLCFVHS